jgi:LEA14-like dessication related protein
MRVILPAAAALAVSSAACSKPSPPTIAPERATVTSIDAQALHLDVTLTATNPNAVDLPVQDLTAHVVVAQLDLGSVTLPKAVTLNAGKATTLDVPISVPWTNLAAVAGVAAMPGDIPFTVDGNVDLGGALLHVGVPFRLTGKMSHDQLAGAALRSLPGLVPR